MEEIIYFGGMTTRPLEFSILLEETIIRLQERLMISKAKTTKLKVTRIQSKENQIKSRDLKMMSMEKTTK